MMTSEARDLPPLIGAGGRVKLPGSKSISNRVLLLAALAEGQTEITGLLDSDDTRVMLAALQALGIAVRREGQTAHVQGGAGRFPAAQADLFMGNAGTAIRPLTAALARGGEGRGEKALFLLGLLLAPLLWQVFSVLPVIEFQGGWLSLLLAGLLVGVGTRYGAGCTSGHGVCGISRLSPRSLVATVAFMASGFATVYVLRHGLGV